jgi:hypothetical protein
MILRTILGACALLLAGIGDAPAVTLNARGEGQLLIFPYYATTGGNASFLTIVNYRQQAKVLRLRVAEGENAQDALSLLIYLAPSDVWTGVLFDPGDGQVPGLMSDDKSCSIPAIRGNDTLPLFHGRRYMPLRPSPADGGSIGPARLREGFIEVLELASIRTATQTFRHVTPVTSVSAPDCGALAQAWLAGGYWAADPLRDLANPTGGIGGELSILNVAAGIAFGLQPTAIEDFRVDPQDSPRGTTSSVARHWLPAAHEPPLSTLALTDPAAGTAAADVIADGRPRRLTYPAPTRAVDAVSAVLMAAQLSAPYEEDPTYGARTSFVLTYPTRSLYTSQEYIGSGAAVAPFGEPFRGLVPLDASTGMRINLMNRESRAEVFTPVQGACGGFGECPPNPVRARLPGTVVEVLGIGGLPDPQLGTRLHGDIGGAQTYRPQYPSGWLQLLATRTAGSGLLRPSLEGESLRGLPVIGVRLITYVNTAVMFGVLANYSTALPMSSFTQCVGDGGVGCSP